MKDNWLPRENLVGAEELLEEFEKQLAEQDRLGEEEASEWSA